MPDPTNTTEPAAPLRGRTALVTGAARGMGRAIAQAVARLGARLVINDMPGQRLTDTIDAIAGFGDGVDEPLGIHADVTDAAAVRAMFRTIAEVAGGTDIVVNNAGVLRSTAFPEISELEWDLVVGANLKGTFLVSQQAVAQMRSKGWGRIVNLSSTAGKNISTLGGAHYTAAKAGILGLTRHLAKEVAGDGITVNAVCPGLIDTDMVRGTIDAGRIAAYERSFPISRLGRPEEVAALVAFLCSDSAAYITGASLDINGGDLMI